MNLIDLAKRARWASVSIRAKSHPHEIAQQDDGVGEGDGYNALHWVLCNDPPLETVRDMILNDTDNAASIWRDRHNGMTPLLIACAWRVKESVLIYLMQSVPQSLSIVDNDGWNSLHHIIYSCFKDRPRRADDDYDSENEIDRICPINVVKQMVQINSSLPHMKDNNGQTPIHLLCQLFEAGVQVSYESNLSAINRFASEPPPADAFAVARDMAETLLSHLTFYHLAYFILKPLHDSSIDHQVHGDEENKGNDILLRIAKLSDPHPVLTKVAVDMLVKGAKKRPSHSAFRQQDCQGNTALHIIAKKLKNDSEDGWNFCVEHLLCADPYVARIRNNDGYLPLELASLPLHDNDDVETSFNDNWSQTHSYLLGAYPPALEKCGISESYYPYILSDDKINSSPCTIYNVLRSRPTLVNPQGQQ